MINITFSGMFLLFVIASPLMAANEKVETNPAASLSSARETDVIGTKSCPFPTVDRSDAAILADRMIQRNGSELLFDIRQRDDLEEEIRRILLLIRDAHPQVSLIHCASGVCSGHAHPRPGTFPDAGLSTMCCPIMAEPGRCLRVIRNSIP